MEREARHLARPRTRLRLTAVTAMVVGLALWLVVSWTTGSTSSSEPLPEPPGLSGGEREDEQPPSEEDGPAGGSGDGTVGSSDSQGNQQGSSPEAEQTVVVHVAGAVEAPGVVELSAGSRVHEAVEAAGGAQEEASLASLNLAAEVEDGSLVTVPTQQEVADGEFPANQTDGPGPGEDVESGSEGEALIDLNRAEPADLEELPGIGPALSERMVTHREQHGAFEALEDLAAVSGIGPAILADLEDLVTW